MKKESDEVVRAREEAKKLLRTKFENALGWRTCWNCNGAHEHLKDAKYVIWCYECGHYFYKGVVISPMKFD